MKEGIKALVPSIRVGDEVIRKDRAKFRVIKFCERVGTFEALRYDTNEFEVLHVLDLLQGQALEVVSQDLEDLTDEERVRAIKLRSLIQRYQELPKKTRAAAADMADEGGMSLSSFYRLLKRYNGGCRCLLSGQSAGGRGEPRTGEAVEKIIKRRIKELYKRSKPGTRDLVVEAIVSECEMKGLRPVSKSTIYRRIKDQHRLNVASGLYGKVEAENHFGPAAGHYSEAIAPLQVVQIDHTPMDISLVDDEQGQIIGQPWLTIAIDVFSRMVVGLYLSFADPNTGSVAVCIYRSAMPKDTYLKQLGVKGEWPVWGMMRTIHADNGPDFRTATLQLACQEHNIDLHWRPCKNPRFGAHIERLAKTVNDEIKKLQGGIPSDFKQRKHLAPEKEALYSLRDLERYLVTWVTGVYHNQLHTSLNCSPLQKFREGIEGGKRPTGLPYPPPNPEQFLLDLTPFEERTVQRHGIEIDNMVYYDRRLDRFILAADPEHPKHSRKFRCRTPLDDARVIYFQNPDTKEYYKIQCADRSMPALTRYELLLVNKQLREKGLKNINMVAIKQGLKALQLLHAEVVAKRSKSSAAQSVRRKQAVTKGLKEAELPLPHNTTQPLPADSGTTKDIRADDIPKFEVT